MEQKWQEQMDRLERRRKKIAEAGGEDRIAKQHSA